MQKNSGPKPDARSLIHMKTMSRLFATAVALLLAACTSSAQQARQMAPGEVVGTVAGAPITLGDVDVKALQEPAGNFGNARLVQALYQARRGALDEIIAARLIEIEAKARGLTADALVQREITGTVAAPTTQDIEFWYQTNPSAVQGRPLEQLREAIKALLNEQRLDAARTRFITALKEKTPVTVSLEPPRQTVATDGHPSRGNASAPIVLVEFSDFQCPFCQRANPTVEQVRKQYGDKIRFVYRHFPLPNHPDARPAAEAAACAEAQGKFWEYHDRLFAEPRLSAADLKAHAAATGLDQAKFNTCVDTHQSAAKVEKDIEEGAQLGVTGTPAFFINGRSIEGAQPVEAFTRIIDEELAAKK
jgi:protein-disulfide isomerase